MAIHVGDKAPDFSIAGDQNNKVSLSQYKGQKVILYFYPKDNTPGCTIEAQQFRDALQALQEHGYAVLGVSRDSVKRHQNFKAKQELNFPLLADTEEEVCTLYDVIKEKKLYGKTYMGIERSTFVIDEEGIVTHVYRNVKAKEHVGQLLADLGIA